MVSPATESSNRKQTIVINNTPNNLRQTTAPSQGMKQTAQDPSKMPTRKVMRIKISYPNEDGTTADPLRVNGQSEPARMRGVTNARPAQGSVLDRYAANAASTRRSSKAGSI
jgi:hypothetical protein